MEMDRREAIKRVAGAVAVATMGGSAMAAVDPVLKACKGGSLRHAYEAADAFAKRCGEGSALPVSIMKTRPEDTHGRDDPFLRHDHHVNVIVPGDEPRCVNFAQVNMVDGSSKVIAMYRYSADARIEIKHDVGDSADVADFGRNFGAWMLSLRGSGPVLAAPV